MNPCVPIITLGSKVETVISISRMKELRHRAVAPLVTVRSRFSCLPVQPVRTEHLLSIKWHVKG